MTQLTNYTNGGAVDNYSWGSTFSQNGKIIYFSSDEFNNLTGQLYKMNTDGNNNDQTNLIGVR